MLQRLPPIDPVALRLDRARAARIDDVLSGHPDRVGEVRDALAAPASPDAAATIEQASSVLLDALRESAAGTTAGSLATRLDRALRTEALEYLDRDDVTPAQKQRGMRLLHWVNRALGSYRLWRDEIVAAVAPADAAHVYDLAAGTGGFARYLARHPPRRCTLRVTSSDLDGHYLALGRRAAEREGLTLSFEVRNALDLRDVSDVDLFLCTQATHHLSPGQIVTMIAGAVRAAPRGILIIDLMRGAANALGAAIAVTAVAPYPPLVHDGVLSVRRSYTPAELTLFARLAGASQSRTGLCGPAFCVLHAVA